MKKKYKYSVLLLDDDSALCLLYRRHIESSGRFDVTVATDGRAAWETARRQIFDLIIVDAKLDFRGYEFGGVRLAEDLKARFGASSIIVISRYITQKWADAHGANVSFMEKSGDIKMSEFCTVLCRRLIEMREKQYVFVAMPFAREYDVLYRKYIRPGIEDAGYKCIRVDEVAHTRSIHEVIFELVEKAKIVVFAADGANANAYYEAGFADAMKKEVVILAKSSQDLKFDINNRCAILYGDRIGELRAMLAKKLFDLRISRPVVL